jgi:hypothetical protein
MTDTDRPAGSDADVEGSTTAEPGQPGAATATTTAGEDAPAEAAGPARPGRRGRVLMIVGIVLVGLLLGGVGTLLAVGGFGGGGDEDVRAYQQRPPEGKFETVDALVISAKASSMVLQPRTGKRQTLGIREPDRPLIDVQHAQSHAALGQPVRVYWDTIDGERVIIYLEDSPEIFR